MFQATISKEELAELPSAEFDGNIIVIDSPDDVDSAIAALRNSDIIGFDTETKPNFKKGQNHTVALVQLSTRSTCYLFRINKIGLADPIVNLLEDESVLKIGLSTHDDFRNLCKIRPVSPKGFVELQSFVKPHGIEVASLSKIYAILFGKRLSKGQRLSNWEAEELSDSQKHYASLDAMACIRIYEKLKSEA